jgi:transposase
MAKPLLSDELWAVIVPVLPKWTPSPKGGQPRLDDHKALTGILFVLKTGIPWEDLPREMNCGCGMTCWRRLRDWQTDGTWLKIHKVLLDRLRSADKIDWSRALIDSSHDLGRTERKSRKQKQKWLTLRKWSCSPGLGWDQLSPVPGG